MTILSALFLFNIVLDAIGPLILKEAGFQIKIFIIFIEIALNPYLFLAISLPISLCI